MASQYLDAHAGERQLALLDVVAAAVVGVVGVVKGVAAVVAPLLRLADGLSRTVQLGRNLPDSFFCASVLITVSHAIAINHLFGI